MADAKPRRVKFTRDFDWTPKDDLFQRTWAYLTGQEKGVGAGPDDIEEACADAAIAAGAAELAGPAAKD